jgi:ribosome-associated heat shock protein Hsp15
VDVWTWAVRLYRTRSAASAACKAGHVKVNGTRAKPAHPVKPGDTVQARTEGGERIVVVIALSSKRTSAATAVQNYEDNSPPPLPRDAWPAPAFRERGAGRPTKRDRRQVEQLRGRG